MIAPQILALSLWFSALWGIYLVHTVRDYFRIRAMLTRRRGELIVAFRKIIVIFCLWSIMFAYVFRTAMVLLGFGEAVAGQVTFFAMLAPNVVGSLFCVVSLRYD